MPNQLKRLSPQIEKKIAEDPEKGRPRMGKLEDVICNDELVDLDAPLITSRAEPNPRSGQPVRTEKTYKVRKGYCHCNICGHKYVEGLWEHDPGIDPAECCTSTCECCSQVCT